MAPVAPPPRMPLLEIENLSVEFRAGNRTVRAIDGVSLTVQEGETVCLVGESGSGKSVTALAIGRLLAPNARITTGEIRLAGREVTRLGPRELCSLRGAQVAYVFQEPAVALNPVMRIGAQILEVLRVHRPDFATSAEVVRLLGLVGIAAPAERARDYPHQLSGGMLQRAMIAMALASQPRLLVADEPTTALDVTIQAQILELLRDLRQQFGMSILLITHHLGIVAEFADRVIVIYAGQVVEQASAAKLLQRPAHPYTRALLAAVPRLGNNSERLSSIAGSVPSAGRFPVGCRFHPRCPLVQPSCRTEAPALMEVEPGRRVRCPFWEIGG